MPDLRISELNNATLPLVGNEEIAMAQSGVTVKGQVGGLVNAYSTVIDVPYASLGLALGDDEATKKTAISSYLENYDKNGNETIFVRLFEQVYNFVLDFDTTGISDDATFLTWFQGRSNQTATTINNFVIFGSKISCEITTDATSLDLSMLNISDIINTSSLIGLTSLDLSVNSFTTADYTALENWANNLQPFTSPCSIDFSSNTDSISGTNLETILLTKNATVIA